MYVSIYEILADSKAQGHTKQKTQSEGAAIPRLKWLYRLRLPR